jgi:hypothetical protein
MTGNAVKCQVNPRGWTDRVDHIFRIASHLSCCVSRFEMNGHIMTCGNIHSIVIQSFNPFGNHAIASKCPNGSSGCCQSVSPYGPSLEFLKLLSEYSLLDPLLRKWTTCRIFSRAHNSDRSSKISKPSSAPESTGMRTYLSTVLAPQEIMKQIFDET